MNGILQDLRYAFLDAQPNQHACTQRQQIFRDSDRVIRSFLRRILREKYFCEPHSPGDDQEVRNPDWQEKKA